MIFLLLAIDMSVDIKYGGHYCSLRLVKMMLKIKFPDNLITGMLSKQKNIPCRVQVSDKFEVMFFTVIPDTLGIVYDWDRELFEERAMAGAGGMYTHYKPALITLNQESDDIYEIVELSLFYNDFGWCPVIHNGAYAPPVNFWDSDDEDPDYVPGS